MSRFTALRRAVVLLGAIACSGLLVVAQQQPETPADPVKQLRETRQCQSCDLREAMLDGVNVEMGDLSYSDLRQASLYKANLRGANLEGAQFTGANLKGADLRNTKGADLVGAITDEYTKCPAGGAGPCN